LEDFDESIYHQNRIRDPIHGFIHFSDAEKKVINLKEFQRLRNIKQLAFTYYVYPGAMHSRFEHSLGVMELAKQAFMYLLKDKESSLLIKESLKEVNLSIKNVLDGLRLAALLHDVGHLPFSHGAEDILPKGKKHEDISIEIIRSLSDKLDSFYFHGITDFVIQLIQNEPIIPELNFMRNILSGQIDVDRMDYLLRDSLHCGVKYGNFDHTRLLETLLVVKNEINGVGLAIDYGGVQALEALILARYYMYTQVLCHRTRRIYDIYLQKYLEESGRTFAKMSNVVDVDDLDWFYEMRKIVDTQEKGNLWAKSIINRDHHSAIYETNVFASSTDALLAEQIYTKLLKEFTDHDFILDSKAEATIHKFALPEEEEGDFFYVRTKQGQFKLITEVSEIIRAMPKRFRVIRIYAKNNSEGLKVKEEIGKRAMELEKGGLS